MSDDVFYFGVDPSERAGHYLHSAGFRRDSGYGDRFGIGIEARHLDGGFRPPGGVAYGSVVLTHRRPNSPAALTILSFWDSSGDSRPGAHSTFVIRGTLTYEDGIAKARAAFPSVFARFAAKYPDNEVTYAD